MWMVEISHDRLFTRKSIDSNGISGVCEQLQWGEKAVTTSQPLMWYTSIVVLREIVIRAQRTFREMDKISKSWEAAKKLNGSSDDNPFSLSLSRFLSLRVFKDAADILCCDSDALATPIKIDECENSPSLKLPSLCANRIYMICLCVWWSFLIFHSRAVVFPSSRDFWYLIRWYFSFARRSCVVVACCECEVYFSLPRDPISSHPLKHEAYI